MNATYIKLFLLSYFRRAKAAGNPADLGCILTEMGLTVAISHTTDLSLSRQHLLLLSLTPSSSSSQFIYLNPNFLILS